MNGKINKIILLFLLFALCFCEKNYKPIRISIYNGCGQTNAAINYKNNLDTKKVNVLELSNANFQNYETSFIIIRNLNYSPKELKILLNYTKIKKYIILEQKNSLTDFHIILGKDFIDLKK